jgi:hypothetical protein
MTGITWESFFIAQVGASAALTGLVFVALSINLQAVMQSPVLIGRAGEALIVLVQPVIVGLAILVPDMTDRKTGVVCLVVTLGGYLAVHRIWWHGRIAARERPRREFVLRTTLLETASIPPVIGSIVLLAGYTGGLNWIAFGAAAAIVVGIADAWILLVEILR